MCFGHILTDSDPIAPGETQKSTQVLEGILILVLKGKQIEEHRSKIPSHQQRPGTCLHMAFLFSTEFSPLSQLVHFNTLSETFADLLLQVNAISQCPLHVPSVILPEHVELYLFYFILFPTTLSVL